MEKIGGNKIGCLVVWCHEQDKNVMKIRIRKFRNSLLDPMSYILFWNLRHLLILLNQLQAPQLYHQIWKSSRQNLLQQIWIYLDKTNLIKVWGKNMGKFVSALWGKIFYINGLFFKVKCPFSLTNITVMYRKKSDLPYREMAALLTY